MYIEKENLKIQQKLNRFIIYLYLKILALQIQIIILTFTEIFICRITLSQYDTSFSTVSTFSK